MQPADIQIVTVPGTPVVKVIRLNGIDVPNCVDCYWTASPMDRAVKVTVTFLATNIETVDDAN